MIGVPGMVNGRNKNFGWSVTIALADSSDLWEETVNKEKSQYYVDGEWRNLTSETFEIKIAGSEPINYTAFYTHRGLLLETKEIERKTLPLNNLKNKVYSLGWTMMKPGEKCFEFLAIAPSLTTV